MNWHRLMFLVGGALSGFGTTIPGVPGVVMTVVGGLLLALSKPEDVSKVTAALSPKGCDTSDAPPDNTP